MIKSNTLEIKERLGSHENMRESISTEGLEDRLQAILDTAVDAIVCINGKGLIDIFNPAAEKLFGYSAAEVVGKNVSLLMPEPYSHEHDSYIEHHEQTGESHIIGIGRETLAKHKDGTVFPIDLAVGETVINDEHFYTGIVRDITERKASAEKLEQYRNHLEELVQQRTHELTEANKLLEGLAKTDSLTMLANRRHFDETLHREIRRAARNQNLVSLLFCDIDYFKNYNDTYGHLAGDECLKQIAQCLNNMFRRAPDLPARYGGEEFAVILPYINSEQAMVLAEQLREAINALKIPHAHSKVADHVTLSIGVATAGSNKHYNEQDLIKLADDALYRAKANGRNRVEAGTVET